jgi:hypothetical protein
MPFPPSELPMMSLVNMPWTSWPAACASVAARAEP